MLAQAKTQFHRVRDHFMKTELDLRNCHFVLVWLAEYSFWTRWNLVETRPMLQYNVSLFLEVK